MSETSFPTVIKSPKEIPKDMMKLRDERSFLRLIKPPTDDPKDFVKDWDESGGSIV